VVRIGVHNNSAHSISRRARVCATSKCVRVCWLCPERNSSSSTGKGPLRQVK
jgi:hypothetical protein